MALRKLMQVRIMSTIEAVKKPLRGEENVRLFTANDNSQLLDSLLQVGINMPTMPNWRSALDMILREARKLVSAEAGSLYLLDGDKHLSFLAVQNDRLGTSEVSRVLLDQRLGHNSVAGFAAQTGLVLNIPNTYKLPKGAPYRVNREFDVRTGYHVESILAVPIQVGGSPAGQCVGVIELFNRIDDNGMVTSFPDSGSTGLQAMAAMAGMTIVNIRLQEELSQAQLETIICLSSAAEHRDDDTAEHVRRVSNTSGLLARLAGLDDESVDLLQMAAPLHDIGKIGIPDSILRKPGPLTPEERSEMETHTRIGQHILSKSDSKLIQLAREIAMTHHERWDGLGYPNKLAGEDIPISGRIVCIADVFDALLSKRCYKPAYSIDETVDVVRGACGKHFDPTLSQMLLDNLDQVLKPYGLGTNGL